MSDIMNDLPELVLGSRTQSSEDIQKVLSDQGYEGVTVDTQSDGPVPAVQTEEADTTSSSVPSTEAGGDAGDVEGETPEGEETASETAEEEPQAQAVTGNKPKGGFKKKLAKLQSENDDLKRQLAERSAEKPAEVKVEEPVIEIPSAKVKPTLEDLNEDGTPKYADYDELTVAIVDWRAEERDRQKLETDQTARKTKADEEAAATATAEKEAFENRWKEQMEVGKSNHDDFETVYGQSITMPAAVPLTEAIKDSDIGAELVYYLAKHKDELDRLNQLLALPKDCTQAQFRAKMRIAYRELETLEATVSQSIGTEEETHAAEGSEETRTTDATRESREAAPKPKPAAAPPAAAPAQPKPKPEPIKPIGNRGPGTRKRLNELTRDEMNSLSPDELRKLVEAA
jgi:hypothetical protein